MKAMGWLAPILLWANSLGAQDFEWVETRFYRVHLRNGNFIDGQLAQQSDRQVTLKMKVGDMAIRRDLIDRVEFIKIRSLHEKPRPVEAKKPPAAKPVVAPAASATPGETTPKDVASRDKVAQIVERLRNAPPERKYDVVSEVMKTDGATPEHLARLLASSDVQTRGHLAEVLQLMKDKEALPALKEHLASGDADLRATALDLIGQLGDDRSALDVRPLLRDSDAAVRGAAVGALQAMGDPDSFDDVAALLLDKEPRVRQRAINCLFEIARKNEMVREGVDALTRALDRARGDAQVDLLKGIGRAGQKETWQTLAGYLRDRDARVRASAAEALGQLNAAESRSTVLSHLSTEDDKKARLTLGVSAARMKITEAIPVFISWLTESDGDLQAGAQHGLRTLSGQNFGADAAKWTGWWDQVKPR